MSIQNVKQHMFTTDGILITVCHLFFLVGAITTVIFTRVYVLGLTPVPTATTAKK